MLRADREKMDEHRWKSVVRKGAAALALVAMLAGGVGIASFLIFSDRTQTAPTATRTPPAPPPPKVPTPREFTIGVVVTAQDCPPGGECIYTYTIEPKYIGMHPLPPDELRIEYQVTGGHEPQNGDFTVHGTEARIIKDVTLAGPPGAQLKAEATKVIVRPDYGPPIDPRPSQDPPPPG
jgi:hypothetical protein